MSLFEQALKGRFMSLQAMGAEMQKLHKQDTATQMSNAARRLIENPSAAEEIAQYLKKKNIDTVAYFDEGGQSIVFIVPDGDLVVRIAHKDFEGGQGRAPTEKVLQPLERQEFENGFIVEFLPFLREPAGRKHVNAIMEGLARDGLEFSDPKPANVRLLPDEKRTPVIIDGDAVDIGRSGQFRAYAAKVKGKPSEYTWEEGLQNSLFSDLCKKYNLNGQEYSKDFFWDSLQEVVDSIPKSGFLYEVASERKKIRDKHERRSGKYSDDLYDASDDDGGHRGGRGGSGHRDRF